MALSSTQIMEEIRGKSEMPDFQKEITKAYSDPVLKPLVQEGANLESKYLSSLFEPFTQMGTNASDMSPAAKLAALGQSMGRLTGSQAANRAMQNFHGASISDQANKLSNNWQTSLNSLWQQYGAVSASEEAAKARAAAARNAAMQFPSMPTMPTAPDQPKPSTPIDPRTIIAGLQQLKIKGIGPTTSEALPYMMKLQDAGYSSQDINALWEGLAVDQGMLNRRATYTPEYVNNAQSYLSWYNNK